MTATFVPYQRHAALNGQPTHLVRVMSSSGIYPDRTLASSDSLFYIGKAISFSVTRYDAGERRNFDFYSEVDWATLSEIRLYSSILLATRREESYVAIYPYRYPLFLYLDEPLEDKSVQRKIRWALIDHMKKAAWKTYPFRGMAAPPALGGDDYDLRKNAVRDSWQKILESKIDISDHLLIRGLSTLLRAVMLWQHHQFAEEAINTIFISLDASFRIILRKLTGLGYKNASSVDAARYISEAFFEDTQEMKYFEEFYESRIKSLHPESRFGIFPHAPLMADDFMHLRDALMEIYANLIGGFIKPDYIEYITSQKRRSDVRLYGEALRLKKMRDARPAQWGRSAWLYEQRIATKILAKR
jgi:hypothetical protein